MATRKVNGSKKRRRKIPNMESVTKDEEYDTPVRGRPRMARKAPVLWFNQWEISDLLGISTTTIDNLTIEGILPKPKQVDGVLKRDVKEVVSIYVSHLRVRRRKLTPDGVTLEAERRRLTKARADGEELKLRTLAGGLMRRRDVNEAWDKLVVAIRQRLVALPTEIDYNLRDAEPLDRKVIVDDAIRIALQELSDVPQYVEVEDEDTDVEVSDLSEDDAA